VAIAIAVAAFLALIWINLALSIKRLHDRDKSAWWLLLFYGVPSILPALGLGNVSTNVFLGSVSAGISIWAFVEIGCLRGTAGPNSYGLDPLRVRWSTESDLAASRKPAALGRPDLLRRPSGLMLYLRDPEHREPIPVRPPAGGRRPARRPKPDPTHRLAPSKACSHSLNKSSKWVTPRKHGATAALVPLLTLLSGLLFYMSGCGASGLAHCSPGFAAVFLRHGHKFISG
jgi:hypothetical protein